VISWIAGAIELTGNWVIGNKNRWGFVINMVCCVLWVYVALISSEARGLLLVVIPAFFVNFRNFIKWRDK